MKIHSAEFLKHAVDLCRARGILMIADEVFTGFFRTGRCFAFEHAGISPDLLCLSKGITGGFLPLAVTLVTNQVFDAFRSTDMARAFLHGHSYTANPIACAAALESWSILQGEECQTNLKMIQAITARKDRPPGLNAGISCDCACKIHWNRRSDRVEKGSNVLQCASGCFGEESARAWGAPTAFGLGDLRVPPYCVSSRELHRIYDVIEELIDEPC